MENHKISWVLLSNWLMELYHYCIIMCDTMRVSQVMDRGPNLKFFNAVVPSQESRPSQGGGGWGGIIPESFLAIHALLQCTEVNKSMPLPALRFFKKRENCPDFSQVLVDIGLLSMNNSD